MGSASASLTTTATADPGLAINPLSLNFSNVPGPSAIMQNITLTDTSGAALVVAALTTAGPFSATTTCATLAAGASCTITASYMPSAAITSGSLTFMAGANTYSVALYGGYTASAAGLELVPAVANFGPAAVGAQTSPRVFTLSNLSGSAQNVSVLIPRQFVLVGPACTTLAAGASCNFSVAFLPLDSGPISGSITAQSATGSTIAYGEGYGNGTATLALSGGLITNQIFDFGQVTSGQSAAHTFTVTNPSTSANLTVRRITSPPPFLASTTCGATLLPRGTCSLTVTYTPTNQVATGTASPPSTTDMGALTIESDATSSPDVLNLTGRAGPVSVTTPTTPTTVATFALSEQSLTFPSTTVGNNSPAQTITLTNTGTVAISLIALGTTADFAASSTCTTIQPGGSCAITVTATPQTAGTQISSLEIATSAATALEFVSLESASTANPLTIAPASLTFGATVVGTSSTLSVQVTNTSTGAILFTGIATAGDYGAAGSCPAAGRTLPAGESCVIQVTFSPTASGARPGTLSISTSASNNPLPVPLTGTGIQSRLVAAPASLAFGSLVLGASATLSLTLTNSGTAPITALVLMPAGDYSVSLPCPATLAVGASCTAQVTFTPTALGARNGTIVITSSDPSSPLTVTLTGTAITSGSFTLTVDGGASSSVSVKSGGPATYHLTVTPTGTFAGSVALTCAPLQTAQFASCSIAPAALTLAGAPQTSVVTINTITSADGNALLGKSARVQGRPMTSRAEKFLCMLLPGTWILFRRRRTLRSRLPVLLAALFLVATLAVSGCGSQRRRLQHALHASRHLRLPGDRDVDLRDPDYPDRHPQSDGDTAVRLTMS